MELQCFFLDCPLPNEAQWGKTGRNAPVACTRKIIVARDLPLPHPEPNRETDFDADRGGAAGESA
jgi:hypothetical protein